MKLLGSYRNGNYRVFLFDDGTKIRENNEDSFKPVLPESMDIKITDCCDCGCPYCHENSTPDGAHGDILHTKFIDTLHPYTELAIGGGNPLCHPDLDMFLINCKERKLIPSMTVNQRHFLLEYDRIKQMCDDRMIYGLGISLTQVTNELLGKLADLPNAVLHIVNGVTPVEEIRLLCDRGLKILILGYKQFRRGEAYYDVTSKAIEKNKQELYDALPDLTSRFEVMSFDNLAIRQLDVSRLLSEDEWKAFYMGNDGQFTMYVDMVNQEFAVSSTSIHRYPLMDDIQSMFKKVQIG